VKDKLILPRVSVVMPVCNGERFLPAALDSLLLQSYENFELIVVNNGSTDGTSEVLKGYAPRFKGRLEVLEVPSPLYPSVARNLGVERSTGEYLLFFDSDDLLLPFSLHLLALFAAAFGSELVSGGFFYFAAEEGKNFLKEESVKGGNSLKEQLLLQFGGNAYPIGATLVKRSAFESVGGFDPYFRYGEDFDLWNRLLLQGAATVRLPFPLYLYRLHSGQSVKNLQGHFKHVDEALSLFFKRLRETCEELLDREFLEEAIKRLLLRVEAAEKAASEVMGYYEERFGRTKSYRLLRKLYLRRFSKLP
jgi:glycosyltransferase involved in cell wall biosynthesis